MDGPDGYTLTLPPIPFTKKTRRRYLSFFFGFIIVITLYQFLAPDLKGNTIILILIPALIVGFISAILMGNFLDKHDMF